MKSVKQAVSEGGDQDRRYREECHAGIQGIERGEELPYVIRDFIDGSHAAEDHGRIHERVNPGEPGGIVIADDADGQGNEQRERARKTWPRMRLMNSGGRIG
jgi:hypothetical protein